MSKKLVLTKSLLYYNHLEIPCQEQRNYNHSKEPRKEKIQSGISPLVFSGFISIVQLSFPRINGQNIRQSLEFCN